MTYLKKINFHVNNSIKIKEKQKLYSYFSLISAMRNMLIINL